MKAIIHTALALALAFGAFCAHARTVTCDGMLPVGENWAVVAQGVPWLNLVTPVSSKSGGGWMQAKRDSEAYFVKRSGESIFFECQVWDGGYVKCAKGELRVQDGKVLARTVAAALRPGNSTSDDVGVASMDGYNSSTPAGEEKAGGYGISSVTIEIASTDVCLVIAGVPDDYGTPNPAYGNYDGYGQGTFIEATCPASWTSEDGSRSAGCTGWKLYRYVEGDNGVFDWVFDQSGDGTSVSDVAHPGVCAKLEWQWEPTYRCTATATTGGMVDVEERFLNYGETFTVTATPESDNWMFAGWTGDVSPEQRFLNPLTLTATDTIAVTATFVAKGANVTWTGAGDNALASNPSNWENGIAPMPGLVVILASGSKDMTWDLDIQLGGWVQDGYAGTVTFPTVYPDAGLGNFTCLNVCGDVTLNSGAWTHLRNDMKKDYRLSVKVTGNMTIGKNATIHADDLGYRYSGGGGHKKANGTSGGCYGGHGGFAAGSVNYTYGSYERPADDLGGGGFWKDGYNLPGGGAIRLEVAGALVHDGAIRANSLKNTNEGGVYYLGSGGGIEVIAGSIAGAGTLKANSYACTATGGGGRIAVKLTGEGSDFSDYDIRTLAQAVAGQNTTGGAGTIYAETQADESGHGWLILKGNGSSPQANELTNADPFSDLDTELRFAKVTFTNGVMALVRAGNVFDLRGCEIVAADVSGKNNGIRLNGGTLLWPVGEGSVAEVACRLECVTAPGISSEKIVVKPYGNLSIDTLWSWTGDIVLSNCATLSFMCDYRIKSLTVNDTTARVFLNGHVLKIAQPKPRNWRMPSYIVPGEDADGNPGCIEWAKKGLVLFLM